MTSKYHICQANETTNYFTLKVKLEVKGHAVKGQISKNIEDITHNFTHAFMNRNPTTLET